MGALACGLAAMLLAGTPTQGKHLETVLQDDAPLLARPPAPVRETARPIAGLGGDRVRLTAGWSAIAPDPRAAQRPGAPFDPRDPATYPAASWARRPPRGGPARHRGARRARRRAEGDDRHRLLGAAVGGRPAVVEPGARALPARPAAV